MVMPVVFIRCDDVWQYDRSFQAIFDFLLALKIPVIYGVIPARLDQELVFYLRQAKERYGSLLDIVTHGYRHVNYAPVGDAKYEFGPERCYEQQYTDIKSGLKIMKCQFGEMLTNAFISPYHADDANTIKAIEALRIAVYSARKPVPLGTKSFIDLPADVWLHSYLCSGAPRALRLPELVACGDSILKSKGVMGVVFRYHTYRSVRAMKALQLFFRRMARWRDQGQMRILLFSDLQKELCIENSTNEGGDA